MTWWRRVIERVLPWIEDRERQLEDYLTAARREANHAHPFATSDHNHPSATAPAVSVKRTGPIDLVGPGVWDLTIPWQAAEWDNGVLFGGAHWSAATPTTLTVRVSGLYSVFAGAFFDNPVSTETADLLSVKRNGAQVGLAQVFIPNTANPDANWGANWARDLRLNAGDTLTLYVLSFAAVTLTGASGNTFFGFTWRGP